MAVWPARGRGGFVSLSFCGRFRRPRGCGGFVSRKWLRWFRFGFYFAFGGGPGLCAGVKKVRGRKKYRPGNSNALRRASR